MTRPRLQSSEGERRHLPERTRARTLTPCLRGWTRTRTRCLCGRTRTQHLTRLSQTRTRHLRRRLGLGFGASAAGPGLGLGLTPPPKAQTRFGLLTGRTRTRTRTRHLKGVLGLRFGARKVYSNSYPTPPHTGFGLGLGSSAVEVGLDWVPHRGDSDSIRYLSRRTCSRTPRLRGRT